MAGGLALGADTVIDIEQQRVSQYNFGTRKPDKVLVTAPPDSLPEAISWAAFGGIISYIGVASDTRTTVQFDADHLHFQKLSIRPSHAWPGTHAAYSIHLLATLPELGKMLVSHRFGLEDIAQGMTTARTDRLHAKKVVVTPS